MRYYVWDTDVAKLLGAYPTETEALSLVRTLVAHYGDEYAEDLAVGVEQDDGVAGQPLRGADLIARVDAVLATLDIAGARVEVEESDAVVATPLAASDLQGHSRGAGSHASSHVNDPNRSRNSR